MPSKVDNVRQRGKSVWRLHQSESDRRKYGGKTGRGITPEKECKRKVYAFCKLVKHRLQAIADKRDESLDEALDNYVIQFLMNLVEAVGEVEFLRKFHTHQFVIFNIWRPVQAPGGEIYFT